MIEDFGWLMSRIQMYQTLQAEAAIPSIGHPQLWPGIQKISVCLFLHTSTADTTWTRRIPDQWVRLTTGLGYLETSFAVLQSKHCLSEGRMLLAVCVCVHARSAAQSCLTLCNPIDCSPPRSSVHGIFQARYWSGSVISYSRGSSQPGIETASPASPALTNRFFTTVPPGK